MPNLQRIQLSWNKKGVAGYRGRAVRQVDLKYFDFVVGGNTFVATDSANTRISMPARSAPQDYIYESATFDIETWDDGWYEWQAYDSADKLLGLTAYYLEDGKIATGSMLAEIKERTDNLPSDPTSETNATANKNTVIAEIDANETKIDSVQADTTAIKAKTDNLPIDPASEANASSNKNSIITEVNNNETKIDSVQVDTTAIKAKTDNLPIDPTSEANATANKSSIITEINENEVKIDFIQTDVTAIKNKTDNLPVDPASEAQATANKNEIITEVDANESLINSVKAKTDNLPIDPTSETQATANKDEIIAEIDGNEGKLDSIKSDTTAIKAQTDNLPSDPASQSEVETAITTSEALIRTDISGVPGQIWDIDIADTEQPTTIEQARYFLGLINSIMRKQ